MRQGALPTSPSARKAATCKKNLKKRIIESEEVLFSTHEFCFGIIAKLTVNHVGKGIHIFCNIWRDDIVLLAPAFLCGIH